MSAMTPAEIIRETFTHAADAGMPLDADKIVALLHSNGWMILAAEPSDADLNAMARALPRDPGPVSRIELMRKLYGALYARRAQPADLIPWRSPN